MLAFRNSKTESITNGINQTNHTNYNKKSIKMNIVDSRNNNNIINTALNQLATKNDA